MTLTLQYQIKELTLRHSGPLSLDLRVLLIMFPCKGSLIKTVMICNVALHIRSDANSLAICMLASS